MADAIGNRLSMLRIFLNGQSNISKKETKRLVKTDASLCYQMIHPRNRGRPFV